MLAYTVWGESGGIGKTTFAHNLAAAHQRMGLDVLAIDMDTQDGGLTKHAGLLPMKTNSDVEKFVHHLTDHPDRGEFQDVIHTHESDGFDVIPSHDQLRNFQSYIEGMKKLYPDENVNPDTLLRETIVEHDLHNEYDVLIIDPPAKTSIELRNALYATRNVLAPVEVSPKGNTSVKGVKSEKKVLEEDMGIEIGVLGLIPNQVEKNVKVKENALEEIIEENDVAIAPVTFKVRSALIGGGWEHEKSIFSYAEDDKSRVRSHEKDTLKRMMYLAQLLTGDTSEEVDALSIELPINQGSREHSRVQPRDENGNFISYGEATADKRTDDEQAAAGH